MTPSRILITGATGFIGSRVAALLASMPPTGPRPPRPALRLLAHRCPPEAPRTDQVEVRRGSLSDPASLHGLCDGIDTVLHLASQIGGSPEQCRAVNDIGTGALLDEAERSGTVRRFVQLGTTAVYRDGAHRGAAENELPFGPASPTSVARLAGEQQVLAAGGLVLRPHLVYGRGDVWVLPALARFMTELPHWVDGGKALISVIGVADLARVIAGLALRPELSRGEALHVCRPEPVRGRDLLTAAARALGLPLPTGEVSYQQALDWPSARQDPGWRRRLSLLTVDHWYDSTRLWRLLGTSPGTSFDDDFAADADRATPRSHRLARRGR